MPTAPGHSFVERLEGNARDLLAVAREISFAAGAEIARQGQLSRGAYLVRSGRAEARVALPGGGTLAVATFKPGDMFGEMALLERGTCTATVVALEDVDGWFIGRDDFRARVTSRDAAALAIQREVTRVLAGKLRALNARLHEQAFDSPVRKEMPAQRTRAAYDWRAFLAALPFFDGFDADEIDELVAIGTAFELPRGAALFRAGERADACYLVLRGALEVFVRHAAMERRVAIAGPGELVGYMALIDGAPRANSARVRERCTLLEMPAPGFLALYEGAGGVTVSLHQAIHRSLMRSLGRTNTQLTRLISAARLRGAREEERALEAARGSELDVVPSAH